jgi:hypothetical protein
MRFACWITKATDTHSEYVILIAFPLRQLLRERASMLIIRTFCVLLKLWLLKINLNANGKQFYIGRRRKQLLDDLKEKKRYWKLKEEALDRTLWRTRLGRIYVPVVRQTAE